MEETQKEKLTIDSWQVDDAMRTLIRAEEIKQDKELMELVAKKAALHKKITDELAGRADKLYTTMNKE